MTSFLETSDSTTDVYHPLTELRFEIALSEERYT